MLTECTEKAALFGNSDTVALLWLCYSLGRVWKSLHTWGIVEASQAVHFAILRSHFLTPQTPPPDARSPSQACRHSARLRRRTPPFAGRLQKPGLSIKHERELEHTRARRIQCNFESSRISLSVARRGISGHCWERPG